MLAAVHLAHFCVGGEINAWTGREKKERNEEEREGVVQYREKQSDASWRLTRSHKSAFRVRTKMVVFLSTDKTPNLSQYHAGKN